MREKTTYVVGAASPVAVDFLVPIAINALWPSDPPTCKVLITFPHVQESQGKAWWYSRSQQMSMPLPLLDRASATTGNRIFLGFADAKGFPEKHGMRKWVQRTAAVVRALGDRELAYGIGQRGGLLLQRMQEMVESRDSASELFAKLLKAIYTLTLNRANFEVSIIERGATVFVDEKEHDVVLYGPVLDSLLRALPRRHLTVQSFIQRGKVALHFQGRQYILYSLTPTSEGYWRAVFRENHQDLDVCIHWTCTQAKVEEISKQPSTAIVSCYGSFASARLTTLGLLGHVPWYLPFQRGTWGNGLQAVEFISPPMPKDTVRASCWVGGGRRLSPSGASLFDYENEEVARFINAVLGEPKATHTTWWLLKAIAECAHYGDPKPSRISRKVRATVTNVVNSFMKMIEAGKGLEKINMKPCGYNYRVNDLVILLFKVLALMKVWRKHLHPRSSKPPKRDYVRALVRADLVAKETFLISTVCGLVGNLLDAVKETNASCDPGLAVILKDAVKAQRLCMECSPSGEMVWFGVLFEVPDKRSWDLLYLLQLKLERVAFSVVLAVWGLTRTVLNANLPFLFLLLGPDSLVDAMRKVIEKRVLNKSLRGTIPIVREV